MVYGLSNNLQRLSEKTLQNVAKRYIPAMGCLKAVFEPVNEGDSTQCLGGRLLNAYHSQ